MTIQDYFTSSGRQAAETWTTVTQNLTDTVQEALQEALTRSTRSFESIDPDAAIDKVFDLWEKSLRAQRDVAKQFAGFTVAAADKLGSQAESPGATVREQTDSAADALRDRVEVITRTVEERAKTRYAGQTKPQLQDALARRDLPKSGTVAELRARLLDADKR